MKRLLFQVAIGEPRPLWERCLASMASYCQRHGIEHRVAREPLLRIRPVKSARSENALRMGYLPNLEKLAGLDLLGSYDRVAIVDSDVWARPDAPDIFAAVPLECDLAGCPERSMPITAAYARKLDWYERGQFGPLKGVGLPFLQFGVIVYNASFRRFLPDGARAMITQPSLERFINGEGSWRWQTEQTTMNWFVRASGAAIAALPPWFNGLYGALQPGEIERCHFVHFFLSDHLKGSDPEEMLRMGNARPRV